MDQDQQDQSQQLTGEQPATPPPVMNQGGTPPLETAPADPPRRSRKKLIFVILGILILLGGSGAAFWILRNQDSPVQVANTGPETVETIDPGEELAGRLNYQLGNKIVSYDPANKKPEELTGSLPKGAQVLDLFVGTTGWQAYYQVAGNQGSIEYWYLTKNNDAVKVAATKEFAIVIADAQNKRLVYTEAFSVNDKATLDEKTVRSYLVTGTDVKRIWQSNETNTGDKYKHPNYAVSDLSKDGKRVLFEQIKFYSDGGGPVAAFELDVANNTTVPVYEGTKYGSIRYSDSGDGYVVAETDDSAIGGPTGAADITVKRIASPGVPGEILLEASSTLWDYVNYAQDFKLVYGLKVVDETSYKQNLVGIYSLGVEGSLTKQAISGLTVEHIPQAISSLSNNCRLLILEDTSVLPRVVKEVGTLCGQSPSLTYSKIDSISWEANDQYQPVSLL